MPELANKLNHPKIDIYNSFNQAASQLAGLVAVDYFFAKEISQSIVFSNTSAATSDFLTSEAQLNQQQWFHLLIALSASLRDGHSCLPLLEVAGKRLFSDGTNLDHSGSVNAHISQATKEHVTGFLFSDIQSLRALLAQLPLTESEQQPIVLSHGRLYLRRYYQFEQELKQVVATRRMISSQVTADNAHNAHNGPIDVEQVKNYRGIISRVGNSARSG